MYSTLYERGLEFDVRIARVIFSLRLRSARSSRASIHGILPLSSPHCTGLLCRYPIHGIEARACHAASTQHAAIGELEQLNWAIWKRRAQDRQRKALSSSEGVMPSALKLLKREPRGTQVSESVGRLFYKHFLCMGALGAERINAEHKKFRRARTSSDLVGKSIYSKPVEWDAIDMQRNSNGTRLRVGLEALRYHGEIMARARNRDVQRRLLRSCLQRKIRPEDLAAMGAWSVHVAADFHVMGYCVLPQGGGAGAVFVQVFPNEADGERVFLVRALASAFEQLFGSTVALPAAIHTVLVPIGQGCITYLSTVVPAESETRVSPSERDSYLRRAEKACARALRNGVGGHDGLIVSLDPALATPVAASPVDVASTLRDIPDGGGIAQSSASALEMAQLQEELNADDVTELRIQLMAWYPTQRGPHDPRFEELTYKAIVERPSTPIVEGFKQQQILVQAAKDTERCPMCHSGREFAQCCKEGYVKRLTNRRRLSDRSGLLVFNPVGNDVAQVMMHEAEASQRANRRFDGFSYLRVGMLEIREIEVRLPKGHIATLASRLHHAELFHSTGRWKWDMLGYFPMTTPTGLLIFGDVELDPDAGRLFATTMSSGRAESLIQEIRHLCVGLDPRDASVRSLPLPKQKLDKSETRRSQQLLKEWLGELRGTSADEIKVEVEVDKKKMKTAQTYYYCAYCHAMPEPPKKLLKCSRCKGIMQAKRPRSAQTLRWFEVLTAIGIVVVIVARRYCGASCQ